MDSVESAAAVGGMIGSMIMMTLIIMAIYWVLLVIARWKMFTKAGEPGWKSIIPIYSDYVGFKLWWDTQNFWIYLGTALAASIFMVLSGKTSGAAEPNMILYYIGLAISLVSCVWAIRSNLRCAHAYGKGTGFGVGLCLLPNIFSLILGFGSARYVGPQE